MNKVSVIVVDIVIDREKLRQKIRFYDTVKQAEIVLSELCKHILRY